jgi:hypothetical protein
MKIVASSPTTRLPRTGDIFRFKTSDGLFRFGRVIKDDAVVGPFKNAWLIYIYRHGSKHEDPPAELKKDDLLVAPMLVNQSPWEKGYFHTVRNEPVKSGDVLPRHAFRNRLNKKLFDEKGNELSTATEPVGDHALKFEKAVADTIVSALEAKAAS